MRSTELAETGEARGEVVWDVDWRCFNLSEGVYKLTCIDNHAV